MHIRRRRSARFRQSGLESARSLTRVAAVRPELIENRELLRIHVTQAPQDGESLPGGSYLLEEAGVVELAGAMIMRINCEEGAIA